MAQPTAKSIKIPPSMSEAARASIAKAPERFTAPTREPEDEPERSLRLRLVTGFFLLAAISGTAGILVMAEAALTDSGDMRALIRDHPFAMLSKPLSMVSTWITWRLLRQRRRLGAVVAAIPFLNVLYIHATSFGGEWYNLLFPSLSVLLIASIWKELE